MENYIRPKIVNKDEGIYGHVDFVNEDGIGGWVIDVKNSEEPRKIEIYINDIKVCEKVANLYRRDIESIIGKKANCGFFVKWSEIELPPKISRYEDIHIKVVDKITQREIIGKHVDRKKRSKLSDKKLVHPYEYKYFRGKDEKYHNWILKNEVEGIKIEEIKEEILAFRMKPKISILMPVYNTPEHLLRETIESVINQIYDNWELCIADDNSSKKNVKQVLEEYKSRYPEKIKVRYRDKNGHICEASNTALELATGEYIALLDHDDVLSPFALYYVVKEINKNPNLIMIYSDEDKISEDGLRYDPYFKPKYNPDLLLSQNYITHFLVLKANVLRNLGGFRRGTEGSQDHDIILRASIFIKKDEDVAHIPKILYHWRVWTGSTASFPDVKPYAWVNGRKAVEEFLRAKGIYNANVDFGKNEGTYRVSYKMPNDVYVSIIIAGVSNREFIKELIRQINNTVNHEKYEIILLIEEWKKEGLLNEDLESMKDKLRIINTDPMPIPAAYNKGVSFSEGEVLIFLDSYSKPLNQVWFEELVANAIREEIGCVGAKIYYPDGKVFSGGVVLGIMGGLGHLFRGWLGDSPGEKVWLRCSRNVSAVCGASFAIRKIVFQEAGWFSPNYERLWDIDLSLRVRKQGYRNLWTPYAEVVCYNTEMYNYSNKPNEINTLRTIYRDWFEQDPYYNPNLSKENENMTI